MANLIKKAGVAADGNGPSPIVFSTIPLTEIRENPKKGFGFFDDFVLGCAGDNGTTLAGWLADYVSNAGDVEDAQVMGGAIQLQPAGAENDGQQIQTHEFVMPEDGYNIAFGARLKVADADQSDFFLGITTRDTDVAQSVPNDCIGFSIADGSANINYRVDKDGGVAAAVDTGSDAADDTYVRLECLVTGEKKVQFYVDGVLKATYTTATYIPDNEVLAFTIAQVNGAGAANACTIDWAYCYQWETGRVE